MLLRQAAGSHHWRCAWFPCVLHRSERKIVCVRGPATTRASRCRRRFREGRLSWRGALPRRGRPMHKASAAAHSLQRVRRQVGGRQILCRLELKFFRPRMPLAPSADTKQRGGEEPGSRPQIQSGIESCHPRSPIPREQRTALLVLTKSRKFGNRFVDTLLAAQSRQKQSLPRTLHVADKIL